MTALNNPVSTASNPNALIALLGGAGGGQVVLTVANQFGWHISAGWASIAAGAVSYLLLYIGKDGFAGIWGGLSHGFGKAQPPAPGVGGDVPPPG